MWQNIVFGLLVGLITYHLYKSFFQQKTKSNKSLEALKNCLLAHALMRTKRADFDDLNMNYASFDGTKLPMMSGCDASNACFTYIITKEDFRKNPFYTRMMEGKIDAVDRYLKRNFDTDEKVSAFFDEYMKAINAVAVSKPTPKPEEVKDAENRVSEPTLHPDDANDEQNDVDIELVEKPTLET
jgi:hypothetical protein